MTDRLTYEELRHRVKELELEVTEKRQTEQALEKEKYYLDQAQEIGNIGTWEHDVQSDIGFWTPEIYKIFEVPLDTKLTIESILDLMHPDDREDMDKVWQAALCGQPYDVEHRIIANGKVKWLREKAKLTFDDDGNLIRAIGVTQDITYRKNAEKKLKEAKAKADDNRYLHRELHRLSGDEVIGADFGLRDVMKKATHVAAQDSIVLLLGETGVGKDVIANAIHYLSSRKDSAFIKVNCGAIPDNLIDSELFGHEKGAFTGALSQKRGRFERADKGTMFLYEIGELPLQAQVRFLKVLQSKEIERVGGVKMIPLDIRIIAATNRDLEEMIKLKQFREDLWFRLNVFPIWIPPLRERTDDIPALLQHFINLKSKELKLSAVPILSPGAIDPLMAYHWPGNVRELGNVIERTLILNPTGPLTFEHLNLGQPKKALGLHEQNEETGNLDEIITRHIRQVLSKTKGKVNGPEGAAAILGMNPSTLRNRMKKLGIDYGIENKK